MDVIGGCQAPTHRVKSRSAAVVWSPLTIEKPHFFPMTDQAARRSSRKRKSVKYFVQSTTLRHRGTGRRIEAQPKPKKKRPHGNTKGEREIRIAATQRAAPLIATIHDQQTKVFDLIVYYVII